MSGAGETRFLWRNFSAAELNGYKPVGTPADGGAVEVPHRCNYHRLRLRDQVSCQVIARRMSPTCPGRTTISRERGHPDGGHALAIDIPRPTMSHSERDRAPGMHDVARRAGVSHQTVSRVLNGLPNVREETRERVTAAIAELGYRRNNAARALVTRRSSMIGVITSGSTLWGPSSTLIAVESAARAAGYYVSLAGLGSVKNALVASAFEYFTDQAVEGIVVIAPEAALAHAADPLVAKVPVVMVAADTQPSPGLHITSVDQEGGARLAVRHLLDQGHRSIVHVSGPMEWFDAAARQRGWLREMEAAGLDPIPPIPGDWTAASGYAAGQLLASTTLPTAIFAANDLMALGVIRAFHDKAVSVPQQVSVVGFDDIPGSAHFIPGLTTVKQDFDALGRQCIDILLSALNGGLDDPAPIAPQLIFRESTAPSTS